jgi:hypothetical protein
VPFNDPVSCKALLDAVANWAFSSHHNPDLSMSEVTTHDPAIVLDKAAPYMGS